MLCKDRKSKETKTAHTFALVKKVEWAINFSDIM